MDMAQPGFFTRASRASVDKCPGLGPALHAKLMAHNFWAMVAPRTTRPAAAPHAAGGGATEEEAKA